MREGGGGEEVNGGRGGEGWGGGGDVPAAVVGCESQAAQDEVGACAA